MKKYLKLYILFFKNSLIREMEFKGNWLLGLAVQGFHFFFTLLFFEIIYKRVDYIAGWTKEEIFFFLGTTLIIDSLFGGIFFFNLVQLPLHIREGKLDLLLLKPVNSRFIVSTRRFNFSIFSGFFLGLIICVLYWYKLRPGFAPVSLIKYILLVINGVLILYSIFFALVTIAFWVMKVDGLIGVFWALCEFGRRPLDIYNRLVSAIFTFIIPLLVIVNFPVIAAIKNLSVKSTLYAIFVGLLFFYLTGKLWEYALSKYSSASS